jgi:hypothetical protein
MTIPVLSGSGHISLATPNGVAVSTGDVFIPPPRSFYRVSQVYFTGRTILNAPATTVTIPGYPSLGLLLFDGVAGRSVSVYASGVNGGSFGLQTFRPDGEVLNYGGGCQSACFLDSQQLPLSGTYAVGVNSGSANVAIYDSTLITQTITPGGAAITLNPVPGQNAKLTFNGNANQQVTVQITGNTISGVVVSLLNPDGSTLATTTSSAASFTLSATLSQTGVQTIFIDPPGSNVGTITVGVQ